MKTRLITICIIFLSLHSFGQQVLGDFTGLDQFEWPKVYWYRDIGNNWDEGLLKTGSSSTQNSVFGRAGFGIHMHESRQFTFWSTNLNPLFAIEGGTGNAYLKGKVGIGTTAPQANLEVKSQNAFDSSTRLRITNNAGDYGRTNLILTGRIQSSNDAWSFGSAARNSIVFAENSAASGTNVGAIGDEQFSMQLEGNSSSLGFLSRQNGSNPNMVLTQNGFVGIGTITPREALSVNGSIRSKEVKVETANWPDYVFKQIYQLKPLTEVKSFIDKNHHLPEIPTEVEIAKDGQNLGEMNKLLLKKVEELTLYLIEKDKCEKATEERLKKLEVALMDSKSTKP